MEVICDRFMDSKLSAIVTVKNQWGLLGLYGVLPEKTKQSSWIQTPFCGISCGLSGRYAIKIDSIRRN